MPSYTLYYFNGRGRAEVIRMMFGAAGVQFTDKRIEFNEWEKYRNEMPSYCMPVLEIDGKNRMPETMAICRYLAREHEFYGKSNMEMFRNDYICDCLYEIMHDYMRYFHEKNGRFRYRITSNMGSNMNSNMGSNMDRNMGSNMNSNMGSNMDRNMGSNMDRNMGSNMDRNMGSNMNSNMGSNMNSNMGSKMNSNLDTKMKSDMDSDMSSNTSSGMGFDGSFMQRRFMETSRRVLPFLERTFGMYGGGKQFFMGEQLMMCDMVMYCFLESPMTEFQTMFNSYPKLTSLWKRVGTHPKISTYLKRRVSTNW